MQATTRFIWTLIFSDNRSSNYIWLVWLIKGELIIYTTFENNVQLKRFIICLIAHINQRGQEQQPKVINKINVDIGLLLRPTSCFIAIDINNTIIVPVSNLNTGYKNNSQDFVSNGIMFQLDHMLSQNVFFPII